LNWKNRSNNPTMTRFKRFTHSLVSAYILLGANIVYTLASVPLALHYLSRAEFGLWALTSQIAAFISLIDLGMNASVARILIDHKDRRADGCYGSAIKTGVLVGAVQGALVLIVGLILVFYLGGWLRVPADLSENFFWLMTGQLFIAAASFVSRTFGQVLYAWQRLDIQNYVQVFQFAVWLAVLWLGFAAGLGVYSVLASTLAGWICATGLCAVACWRLRLWPQNNEWGRVSLTQFQELFNYAADLFLIALGTQIILSSQVVLITRMLGMEAVAVWSVMTKAFMLISQIIFKIVGTTMPALAEMQARQENTRLWERYRGLFYTVTVVAAVCAIMFAACNSLFVAVWTHGQISWPIINDVLLAVWLLIMTQQCCHNSLIICLKQVRELKYTYLLEGMVFTIAAIVVLPRGGITGMLVCSLVCTLIFTTANGVWRVAGLARKNQQSSLWTWQWPQLRVLLVMTPCWLLPAWLLRDVTLWWRLLILFFFLGLGGFLVAVWFALPRHLTLELLGKLPLPVQRVTLWVLPPTVRTKV
jgi:O-antigen/teichoic acid export membrane protein